MFKHENILYLNKKFRFEKLLKLFSLDKNFNERKFEL